MHISIASVVRRGIAIWLKLAKKKDNPFWSYSAEIVVVDYIWYMINLERNMSVIGGIDIQLF
jgi:hypothetical protein